MGMILRMYIANIEVAAMEISHNDLKTLEERQKYNEKKMREMLNDLSYGLKRMIAVSKQMPEFYITGVESKMNRKIKTRLA